MVAMQLSLPKKTELPKKSEELERCKFWNISALEDKEVRQAFRKDLEDIVLPKLRELTEAVTAGEDKQRCDEIYEEMIDLGNQLPEAQVPKTLPIKKKSYHRLPTLLLIQERLNKQKYTDDWWALTYEIRKSSRKDKRASRRRALGDAAWDKRNTKKFNPPQGR